MSDMIAEDTAEPTATRPVVRLRPKAEARAIRHGFPWVYSDELVTDRRTQALAAGTICTLEDDARRPLATVTVNTKSKIIARVLDRDAGAVIDRAWIAGRLARALELRARLFDEPFYRLVHAEADGLPGVIIDRFGDLAVIQPNAAWAEAMIDDLAAALAEVTGVQTVVKNGTGRARGLEGLPEETVVLQGAVTGPVAVPMNGATYMADVLGGQKTGLFFDQRPNHAFAARLAQGGTGCWMCFPIVGGFALACLAGGAESALSVDASGPALDLAGQGCGRNGNAGALRHPSGRCLRHARSAGRRGRAIRSGDLRPARLRAEQAGAAGRAARL